MLVFKWLRRSKADSCEPDTGRRGRGTTSAECVAAVDEGVFELVGPAMASDAASDAPRDLVQTLYEQYCGALDAPLASLANEWAAQTARPPLPPPLAPSPPARGEEPADPIDLLLSRARTIDEVLGLLGPADAPDPAADEPIPDILRLFAPAEHQAGRRTTSLPPALARREHQALAIDSPLATPRAAAEPRT
jgi:hypothetical protein